MENTFDGTHHLPLQSADARACTQKNQEQIFPLFARIPSLRRTHGYGLSRRALLDVKLLLRARRYDCRDNTILVQTWTSHRRAFRYSRGIYRRIDNALCVKSYHIYGFILRQSILIRLIRSAVFLFTQIKNCTIAFIYNRTIPIIYSCIPIREA